jgi:hypothetical protein
VGVGLGSQAAGAKFAEQVKFPSSALYADPTSVCYQAMNFDKGAFPDSDISGYAKLALMLAGIGSPGTMQVCPQEKRLRARHYNLLQVQQMTK